MTSIGCVQIRILTLNFSLGCWDCELFSLPIFVSPLNSSVGSWYKWKQHCVKVIVHNENHTLKIIPLPSTLTSVLWHIFSVKSIIRKKQNSRKLTCNVEQDNTSNHTPGQKILSFENNQSIFVKCVTIYIQNPCSGRLCCIVFNTWLRWLSIGKQRQNWQLSCKTKILELVSSCILADCRVKNELLPGLRQKNTEDQRDLNKRNFIIRTLSISTLNHRTDKLRELFAIDINFVL